MTHSDENAALLTVTLEVEGWTWDECIFCGASEVTERGWLLLHDGMLAQVGWCAGQKCQVDRAKTYTIPADAITLPGGGDSDD